MGPIWPGKMERQDFSSSVKVGFSAKPHLYAWPNKGMNDEKASKAEAEEGKAGAEVRDVLDMTLAVFTGTRTS